MFSWDEPKNLVEFFVSEDPSGVIQQEQDVWDLTGPFPVPRDTDILREHHNGTPILRDVIFHYRHNASTPYRCDVMFKCAECSYATWGYGLVVPREMYELHVGDAEPGSQCGYNRSQLLRMVEAWGTMEWDRVFQDVNANAVHSVKRVFKTSSKVLVG